MTTTPDKTDKTEAGVADEGVVWQQRSLRQYAGITLRGIAIGSSDIVPGVSGGTMAFILGIYEELINSIRTFGRPNLIRAVFHFQIKEIFRLVNWKFLLALGLGIFIAVITLAGILEHLLVNQPVFVWSFFFGLVLASVFVVSKRIKKWTPQLGLALIIGAVAAFSLVGIVPLQTPTSWWFLMLAGAMASTALILPGISGAFILVLLGKYQFVLGIVNDLRGGDISGFVPLFFLGLGAVLGLITISQLLSWLFRHHHDYTVAVLIGFMLGSLRKIWPWKQDVEWLLNELGEKIVNSDGQFIVIKQWNVLPDLSTQAGVTEFVVAVVLVLLGIAAILAVDKLGGGVLEKSG